MKALDEIISEIDVRQMPEDASTIAEYVNRLLSLEKRATSRTAMLIATARRKIMKNGEGLHKWTRQFEFSGNYTSHIAAVGDMLLDARPEIYLPLKDLPYNKLEPLSSLDAAGVEKCLSEHDVNKMSREELRAEVGKLLGRPEKAKTPEEERDCWKWIQEIASSSLVALSDRADKGTDEDVAAMAKAAGKMMVIGVSTMVGRKIDSLEGLEELRRNMKQILSLVESNIERHNNAAKKKEAQNEHARGNGRLKPDPGVRGQLHEVVGEGAHREGSRDRDIEEGQKTLRAGDGLSNPCDDGSGCGAAQACAGMGGESNGGALLQKGA